jgi:hypothetical protein
MMKNPGWNVQRAALVGFQGVLIGASVEVLMRSILIGGTKGTQWVEEVSMTVQVKNDSPILPGRIGETLVDCLSDKNCVGVRFKEGRIGFFPLKDLNFFGERDGDA